MEFDGATRQQGFASLLREDWAALATDPAATRAARAAASARFALSKPLRDELGVDFFVSHNWSDENAPHRWVHRPFLIFFSFEINGD